MKRQFALLIFAVLGMNANALAIGKDDPATSIAKGTEFVATSDLTILANAEKVQVFFNYVDRVFQTCNLYVKADAKERVLRTGSVLIVDRTERVKSGAVYPDGYAVVVYFNHPTLLGVRCFAGEPFGDNHKVPKFSEMEKAIAANFAITPAGAEQVPAKNICK